MGSRIRIGTRKSPLAVWQANLVQELLLQNGYQSELVYIKNEGDLDLQSPLYEMGIQGIFTKNLDSALLNKRIDLAVHSMKDVPTQPANGIVQAAVLPRASYKDLFVPKNEVDFLTDFQSTGVIATSSMRRKAQWLHRYPNHRIENLRGNVNSRLHKVEVNEWDGAIFAAAGLERINLRPENAITLDWMLPAPGQGAIMLVCREADSFCMQVGSTLNDPKTALCTKVERDFLRTLLGGCSTPIAALAEIRGEMLFLKGNILSIDGKDKVDIEISCPVVHANELGRQAAGQLLQKGGQQIAERNRYAGK